MSASRPFRVLAALAAIALILRMAGIGASVVAPGLLLLVLACAWLLDSDMATHPASWWRDLAVTHRFAIGLGVIVLLSIAVRLAGINTELGHTPLDMDEQRFAENVRHFFATGELAHETVEHYPGAVFWMFAAASFLGYLRRITHGVVSPPDAVRVELFVAWARYANILVAAATTGLTGLVGRRIGGNISGLIAALVVAIVPLAVETTTMARNDPGMTLAVVAATAAALASLRRPARGWVVASGVLAGVAAAIKYSGVFAIAPAVLAAGAAGSADERARRVGLALVAFVAAVAVTNHFVWYDVPTFLRQLADQMAITGPGRWSSLHDPAGFYIAILSRFGPGGPLLLLAAAFAVAALGWRRMPDLVFLSFPLLYMWFMTQHAAQFPRWVYPLAPFVAVAGSAALVATGRVVLMAGAPSPRRRRMARTAVVTLAGVVLWWPVYAGTIMFSRRRVPPTHVRAEQWIAQHVHPGDVVLAENEWLDLQDSSAEVRRVADLKAVLDGGPARLAGVNWVVVPEPNFGHQALKQLTFVQRFQAKAVFGGSLGYDYEVYAVPQTSGPAERR